MALSVFFSKDCPLPNKGYQTNIPIDVQIALDIVKYSDFVTAIHADGHEHEFILKRFNNLPHGHASTTWAGEWARFIAVNFPYS